MHEQTTERTYFKHSGAIPPTSPIILPVVAALGISLLALAYGYIIKWNPFIYVDFILTGVYGFAAGGCVFLGLMAAKVRSHLVAFLAAVAGGLFAVYASWVVWLKALVGLTVFEPAQISLISERLAETGVWRIFSFTPTGGALELIWTLEALAIFLLALVAPIFFLRQNGFCENCETWCESTTVGPLGAIADAEAFTKSLELGHDTPFEILRPIAADAKDYTQVELQHCPRCEDLRLLTVICKRTEVDHEGRETHREARPVQLMHIDAQRFAALAALAAPETAPGVAVA